MAFGDGGSLLDPFTRADEGPPPSSSWTTVAGADEGLEVFSNGCRSDTTTINNAAGLWNTVFGADQEAWATMSTVPTDDVNRRMEVWCRAATGGTGQNGYVTLVHFNQFANENQQLFEGTGFSLTQIGGSYDAGEDGWNDGDKIGIETIGTTIACYRDVGAGWVQSVSATDSTYDGSDPNDHIGLGARDGQSGVWDDFSGGNAVTVVPVPFVRYM